MCSGLYAAAALNIDFMITGHLLGAAVLGIYVLAWNVASWPVNAFITAIQHLSIAGFARLQKDRERLIQAWESSLRAGLLATGAVCALLAGLSEPLVYVLYGQRWAATASLLVFLAALGCIRVATTLATDLMIAAGWIRDVFFFRGIWLASLAIILPIGAVNYGVVGVAAGQVLVGFLVLMPALGIILRRRGFSLASLARAIAPTLSASAVAYAAAFGFSSLSWPYVARVAVGAPVALLVYGLLSIRFWLPGVRTYATNRLHTSRRWRHRGNTRIRYGRACRRVRLRKSDSAADATR